MKKNKINYKIGDTVKIISGYSKNKIGKIIKINKNTGKVVVKGVNFHFKHVKPTNKNDIGEIKQIETPIHHSNIKLFNKNL